MEGGRRWDDKKTGTQLNQYTWLGVKGPLSTEEGGGRAVWRQSGRRQEVNTWTGGSMEGGGRRWTGGSNILKESDASLNGHQAS